MSYRQLTHGVIGTTPRACRPYRAKTKGKVERIVRETKESMLPWLTGQVLPSEPTLADYDQLGRIWIEEIVLPRRQRTTKRVVSDAWSQERPLLAPVPNRLLHPTVDVQAPTYPSSVIDLTAHRLGEHVPVRDLAEYEVAL
jgi:hypothetical protein